MIIDEKLQRKIERKKESLDDKYCVVFEIAVAVGGRVL